MYDPAQQDKIICNALDTRLNMITEIIKAFPAKKRLEETKMEIYHNDYLKAEKEYIAWKKKKTNVVPAIETMCALDNEM